LIDLLIDLVSDAIDESILPIEVDSEGVVRRAANAFDRQRLPGWAGGLARYLMGRKSLSRPLEHNQSRFNLLEGNEKKANGPINRAYG
jgi:hypothetical protein